MKTFLSVLLIMALGSCNAFAEGSASEFEKLENDVGNYLILYQASQMSTAPAKKILEEMKATQAELEAAVKDPKAHLKELRKTYREMKKEDRVSKAEFKELRANDPGAPETQKKLAQINLNVKAAQAKYDALEKARVSANSSFAADWKKFKAREKTIQPFVNSKTKVRNDKDKDAKEIAGTEPEQLKAWLAQSPKELMASTLGKQEDSAQLENGTTSPTAAAPATGQQPALADNSNTNALAGGIAASAAASVAKPSAESITPPTPFKSCDETMIELTQVVLKNNSKILSSMVTLAALKMAYRLSPDKKHLNTLEEYANQFKTSMSKDSKSKAFQKKLGTFYQTHGEALDRYQGMKIFTPGNNSYQKNLRLDNGSSSALILYLSELPQKNDSRETAFTEVDAAAVWAQSQIFTVSGYAAGQAGEAGVNSNLLNFSTQVYHLLNIPAKPGDVIARTQADFASRITKQEEEIRNALQTSVKSLEDISKIGCFTEVQKCTAQDFKLGDANLSKIQQALATSISKGVKTESEKSFRTIDFKNSEPPKNGVIDLKLVP